MDRAGGSMGVKSVRRINMQIVHLKMLRTVFRRTVSSRSSQSSASSEYASYT